MIFNTTNTKIMSCSKRAIFHPVSAAEQTSYPVLALFCFIVCFPDKKLTSRLKIN